MADDVETNEVAEWVAKRVAAGMALATGDEAVEDIAGVLLNIISRLEYISNFCQVYVIDAGSGPSAANLATRTVPNIQRDVPYGASALANPGDITKKKSVMF
ncbi:hypothetical protein BGZ72_008749 [Mortierella alpina]|nr:hypothetical protein BGZ72_008749 [Mortierella alpina]